MSEHLKDPKNTLDPRGLNCQVAGFGIGVHEAIITF